MSEKIKDTHLPVTITSEEIEFDGFRTVASYHYRENTSGLAAKRELVIGQHAAAVVVFDPTLKKLVMIQQFRLGAQLGTGSGLCAEIVAGLIDEDEEPIETAKREMLEETGLTAIRIEPICSFLTTPGLTNETIHLFYAEADASNLSASSGLASETEQTFPFLVSLEEAMEAVDKNEIYNGIAMLGLMWFERLYKTKQGKTDE